MTRCSHCGTILSRPPLTSRQQQALTIITEHIDAHSVAPTRAKLAAALSVGTANTQRLVMILVEKGYLSHIPGAPQAISVIKSPSRAYNEAQTFAE